MDKIWFIEINGKPEGPFSVLELKRDRRITPETLVWREGFENWVPIRKVYELKEVFQDEEPKSLDDINEEKKKLPKDEIVALNLPSDFPPVIWLFVLLIAIMYLMYWLYTLHE